MGRSDRSSNVNPVAMVLEESKAFYMLAHTVVETKTRTKGDWRLGLQMPTTDTPGRGVKNSVVVVTTTRNSHKVSDIACDYLSLNLFLITRKFFKPLKCTRTSKTKALIEAAISVKNILT